jgi:anaerobic magnesium-protoporphyrin IX monomethyl ester cyclase
MTAVNFGTDILLVNPSGRRGVYQALGDELTAIEPPLWVRLIAGYLIDHGVAVQILDAEAWDLSPQAIAEAVEEARPLLVAMIVFGHQPSASTQQMPAAGEACRAIKRLLPDQKIAMAGGHVSALPERTLLEEAIDYACAGEGPVTFFELIRALRGSGLPDEVPGLVWRRRGAARSNPLPPLVQSLDRELHGNVWPLLPMERYRAHNWHCFGQPESRRPYASIYTSLGCPYRCTFCCINAPFGVSRYRMRTPAAVVAEIDYLHSAYGVKAIKIVDEMFVLNRRHVREICEGLAAREYAKELNIWAYARVDTVEPADLGLMRAAGIRWLALGIESASAHVRDGAAKPLDSGDIVETVAGIRRAGIHVIGNFIFGLPDDDLSSMRETLQLAQELNCEFANFYSAMAYPGSALYREALAQGLRLPESWSGYSQHSADCTPLPTATMSCEEVLSFRDYAFHAYFSSERYLGMLERTFGAASRRSVEGMTRVPLYRRLLETERSAAQ